MRFVIKLVSVVGLCFSLAQVGLAKELEEGKTLAFDLGQVVVTATKTERQVKNVSSAVTVITKEEIAKSGAREVGEVLKGVPGIWLYDKYGQGFDGHIGLRGFAPYGSERVLIMVDGVPWNSCNDGFVAITKLPIIEDIEKIEIVRGPSSALYGGFAMGGVINIITRKGPEKAKVETEIRLGRFAERKYRVEVGGTSGNLNYRISTSYRSGDGYRDHTEFIKRNTSGKLNLGIDEGSDITLDFDVQSSDLKYAGYLTEAQYQENPRQAPKPTTGDLESQRLSLTYNRDIDENNHIKGQVFTTRYDYDYPGTYRYMADIDGWGGELQYTLTSPLKGMKNCFILGFALRGDDVNYKYYYSGNLRTDDNSRPLFWGIYLQDELTPIEPLTLTLGGRLDKAEYDYKIYYDHYGYAKDASVSFDEFSPKFGALYRLTEDISLFGNTGKAFMPPSAYRMFTSKYRNPYLEPEIAWNYELGIKGLLFDRFSFQLSGYWMNVKDEITSEAVSNPYTGESQMFLNSGKTRHKGIEVETSLWIAKGLSAFVNANFQEAKFREYKKGTTVYDGKRLPHAPSRTFTWGLRYEHPIGITYNINANYRSDAYSDNANTHVIPSRTIWDTRLDYDCEFKGVDVGFYVGIRNLFDKKYYEHMTSSGKIYPAYPRNYIIGLTFSKEF